MCKREGKQRKLHQELKPKKGYIKEMAGKVWKLGNWIAEGYKGTKSNFQNNFEKQFKYIEINRNRKSEHNARKWRYYDTQPNKKYRKNKSRCGYYYKHSIEKIRNCIFTSKRLITVDMRIKDDKLTIIVKYGSFGNDKKKDNDLFWHDWQEEVDRSHNRIMILGDFNGRIENRK